MSSMENDKICHSYFKTAQSGLCLEKKKVDDSSVWVLPSPKTILKTGR